MASIEFVVRATPVSQQARRGAYREAWKARVAEAARRAVGHGHAATSGRLSVTIMHFSESIAMDVDNLPKPILDALKGVLYLDGRQIQQLIVRRHSLTQSSSSETDSALVFAELSTGLEFVHVKVTEVGES